MRRTSNSDFAVIGLGRYGSVLARRLEAFGYAVLGIDVDAKRVRAIQNEITTAVIADATDEDALLEVDIASFGTVVVAVSGDFGAAAQIAASVKDMGVPQVIVQADSARERDILLRIGADDVAMPLQEGAERLADQLILPGVLTTAHLGAAYTIAEFPVSAALIGKRIAECETHGVTVIMLARGEELTVAPHADIVLEAGDLLLLLGGQAELSEFFGVT